MPPRISWSNLLPGLIALVAIVLIATGVLLFAGVGRIRGEKVRLYVLTDQARGLMRGSEVWLAGQKIGEVDAIEFRPPSDTTARVVIAVSVKKRNAEHFRRDSRAQVRPGANVIGPIVLYVVPGTPTSPSLREGDTLMARAQSDFEAAGANLSGAVEELAPLLADARTVMAQVRDTGGTIGAWLTERGGGELTSLRARLVRLRDRTFNGGETHVGIPSVLARTRVALARADSIRTLLRSPNVSLGRFRRDSSLSRAVASVRDEIAELRATLARADGTLGRFDRDGAFSQSMATVHREMTLLFDDMRRRPLRYVNF